MLTKQGNTSGNINNRGFVTTQDGWIYFLGVYRGRTDGSGFMVMNDDSKGPQGMYLNVIGGWLYYSGQDKCIYKVRTDRDFEDPNSGW